MLNLQKRGVALTRRLALDHLLWMIFDVAVVAVVAVVKVLLPQAQAVEGVTRLVVGAEEAV
jgi:hypothetical protein